MWGARKFFLQDVGTATIFIPPNKQFDILLDSQLLCMITT